MICIWVHIIFRPIISYRITIASVRIIIDARAIVKITFRDHLNQVEYSTPARARPPIMAPHVGVIRFTKPFDATIVINVVSTLYPKVFASGPMIGVLRVASPDDDGTSIDSPMCNK